MNWEVRTMRSGTSCFNTVYRKNLTRFWPLWAIYGMVWLFIMPLNLLQRWMSGLRWMEGPEMLRQSMAEWAMQVPQNLIPGLCLAAAFGVFCAMAVFGYLYTTRSVCMMQALPMNRRQLFTAQYLGGLSLLILPNVVIAVLTAALELCLLPSANWGTALSALGLWLAVQSGLCLFFYSFAVFCAMFTGNVLALPVFYGILNFLVMGVYMLVQGLMAEFFYGYSNRWWDSSPTVEWLTPFVKLMDACVWSRPYWDDPGYQLRSPGAVAVYAAAGVVLAVLAVLVYQRRHAESAGDVVAIPVVRPVFRCGVAFCTGLSMGIFTAVFFGWESNGLPLTLLVVLWTAVGWFVAEMFLRRSFRVLRAWKGCLVMMAVSALLCAGCMFDLFGVQSRVPAADRVESVTVSGSMLGYPNDGASREDLKLTGRTQVEKVIALHQAIVDWHNAGEDGANSGKNRAESLRVELTYHLRGGGTLSRSYYAVSIYEEDVDQPGTVAYAQRQLTEDRDIVAAAYGFDRYDLSQWIAETWEGGTYHADRDRGISAYLDGVRDKDGGYNTVYLDGAAGEDLDGLWTAVLADFKAGTLGRRYQFDSSDQRLDHTCRTDLVFEFKSDLEEGRSWKNITVTLTPDAENTLAWLRENSGLGTDYTVPTYRQWTEGEYEDAAEKFYNDDTAGKTFDAATGEEVLETIGGADGPTAVITTTLG